MDPTRINLQADADPLPGLGTVGAPAEVGAKANVVARPFVSVIIAVWNEARYLAATLDGLLHQDYPPDRFEVLVVDGQSTDATAAIAAAVAQRERRVRLLHNPKRWASAGHNAGIAACRGDIVAIVDGHTDVHDRQFLSRLAEVFERTGADCVGYPQPLTSESGDQIQLAVVAARASALGRHPASVTYAAESGFVSPHPAAVAYRRAVFERVGGFDESFDACQDLEFSLRVARSGFRCYYTSELSTPYYARTSLRALFRQQVRYGRGRLRLLRRHPGTFALATFLPALLVLSAIATLPLLALSNALAAAYALGAGLYLGVVAVQAIWLARRCGWRLLPWLLAAIVTIHAGAGVGILVEMVSASPSRHERGTR